MLKKIRKLNFGYILVIIGITFISFGFSLKEEIPNRITLICFDGGCIYVQSISSIILGLFTITVGVLKLLKSK